MIFGGKDMSFNKDKFLNPDSKYRVRPLLHAFCVKDDPTAVAKALKAYGYGGAVINPKFNDETFVTDEALKIFKETADGIKAEGLDYWIYDEKGYPSGQANGFTLKGHPELEAKGFFMVRRIAYEPRHTTFTIDDETDKIVWAAKYPVDASSISESCVQYDKMIPVDFTESFVECDLEANEAFFIFCQKPAYEGSHLTHNVSSFKRYINLLNPNAVKRFIELMYDGIDKACLDVFKNAGAVFTDEPSLQTGYARAYETWPYALAPYCDTLFEEYKKEYGTSLLPYLPLIFENGAGHEAIRINFYRLVAKLIAKAFSGQISEWCRAHGTVFSGHYFAEESLKSHVNSYGDNIPVIMAADYPGIDTLLCIPEEYNCNTAKHVQMVVRKKDTNGMMVELCPFLKKPEFAEDPWNNMSAVVGLLAMHGVRVFNSYFRAEFGTYDKRFNNIEGYAGRNYESREDCIKFNEYVGRIGYMLDGLKSVDSVFVYRPIEDAQAKYFPTTSGAVQSDASQSDNALGAAGKLLFFKRGIDFQFVDCEDMINAAESLKNGKPTISGLDVKTIIVPGVDVMDSRAQKALVELKAAGVNVLFHNKLPSIGTDNAIAVDIAEHFKPVSTPELNAFVDAIETDFVAKADGLHLLTAKYLKDGKEMYFVVNNTRGTNAELTLNHKTKTTATLFNPVDGTTTPIKVGDTYTVPWFRSVFIIFD